MTIEKAVNSVGNCLSSWLNRKFIDTNVDYGRRRLLKTGALAVAGAFLPRLPLIPDNSVFAETNLSENDKETQIAFENARKRFPDIISPEDLAKMNINVNQVKGGPKVFFRPPMLERLIFKHTVEGKIKGLEISFMDGEEPTYRGADNLPADAKKVLKYFLDPQKKSDRYWEEIKILVEQDVKYLPGELDRWRAELEKVESGEVEAELLDQIAEWDQEFQINPENIYADKMAEGYRELLDTLLSGKAKTRLEHIIKIKEILLERAKVEAELFKGSLSARAKYYQEHNPSFLLGLNIYLGGVPVTEKDIEIKKELGSNWNKAFIYIATGGVLAPSEDQSYPGPNEYLFGNNKDSSKTPLGKSSIGRTIGEVLGHELEHYTSDFGYPDGDFYKQQDLEGYVNMLNSKHTLRNWENLQAGVNTYGIVIVFGENYDQFVVTKDIQQNPSQAVA